MSDPTYFSSERFIFDDLAKRAERMVEEVRAQWREKQRITNCCITWPAEVLKDDAGREIQDAVYCVLPPGEEQEALRRMVERTKAYALVLIEQKKDELRVLFESHHGARAWLIPLELHGDVRVPGATRVTENAECVGLLWKPARGSA
jgi:hypothetical protein